VIVIVADPVIFVSSSAGSAGLSRQARLDSTTVQSNLARPCYVVKHG
jgi:hypothetical protein